MANMKHGLSKNYLYTTWKSARNRCQSPNSSQYEWYGARGIEVRLTLAEWMGELGPRPGKQYQVDRIDNEGHYEKGNLRWATASLQQTNKRKYKNSTSKYRGVSRRADGKFVALAGGKGTQVYLGVFNTEEQAALAYDLYWTFNPCPDAPRHLNNATTIDYRITVPEDKKLELISILETAQKQLVGIAA